MVMTVSFWNSQKLVGKGTERDEGFGNNFTGQVMYPIKMLLETLENIVGGGRLPVLSAWCVKSGSDSSSATAMTLKLIIGLK